MNPAKSKARVMPGDCAKKSQAVEDIMNGVIRAPTEPKKSDRHVPYFPDVDPPKERVKLPPKIHACPTCDRLIRTFCWKCAHGQ